MLRQTFNVLIMDHVRSWLCWRVERSEGKGAGKNVFRLSSDIKSISHVSSWQMSRVPSSSFQKKKGEMTKSSDAITVKIKSKSFSCRTFLLGEWKLRRFRLAFMAHIHPSTCHSISLHATINRKKKGETKQHSIYVDMKLQGKFNQNEKWTQNEWKIQIKINSRQTSEMTHALTLQVHFHILRAGKTTHDVMSTSCRYERRHSSLQRNEICVVRLIRSECVLKDLIKPQTSIAQPGRKRKLFAQEKLNLISVTSRSRSGEAKLSKIANERSGMRKEINLKVLNGFWRMAH